MMIPGALVSAIALGASLGVAVQAPAMADTETSCGVTHNEWDDMRSGLTVNQVYNRFDVYGIYLSDNENVFRRGYRTCWAPGEKQAVVVFSYNSGESVDWYVRDVD